MKKIICIFLSLALFVSFNTAGVVLADGESGMVQTITPLDDACYDPYPKWASTSPYLYAQRRNTYTSDMSRTSFLKFSLEDVREMTANDYIVEKASVKLTLASSDDVTGLKLALYKYDNDNWSESESEAAVPLSSTSLAELNKLIVSVNPDNPSLNYVEIEPAVAADDTYHPQYTLDITDHFISELEKADDNLLSFEMNYRQSGTAKTYRIYSKDYTGNNEYKPQLIVEYTKKAYSDAIVYDEAMEYPEVYINGELDYLPEGKAEISVNMQSWDNVEKNAVLMGALYETDKNGSDIMLDIKASEPIELKPDEALTKSVDFDVPADKDCYATVWVTDDVAGGKIYSSPVVIGKTAIESENVAGAVNECEITDASAEAERKSGVITLEADTAGANKPFGIIVLREGVSLSDITSSNISEKVVYANAVQPEDDRVSVSFMPNDKSIIYESFNCYIDSMCTESAVCVPVTFYYENLPEKVFELMKDAESSDELSDLLEKYSALIGIEVYEDITTDVISGYLFPVDDKNLDDFSARYTCSAGIHKLENCENDEDLMGIFTEFADSFGMDESLKNTVLSEDYPEFAKEGFVKRLAKIDYNTKSIAENLNDAVLKSAISDAPKYGDLMSAFEDTGFFDGFFTDTFDSSRYSKLKSKEKFYKELISLPLDSESDIRESIEDAAYEVYKSENLSGSGGGGKKSGGSKSFGSISTEVLPAPVVTPGYSETVTGSETTTQTLSFFTDVPEESWMYESVKALSDAKIISGYSDNSFRPDGLITREEFVKIIVGALEIAESSQKAPFDDVEIGRWSEKYINAAVSAKIINGTGNGIFSPESKITRQDAALICYRAIGIITSDGIQKEFADKNDIADYATEAVGALSSAGIINGDESGCFRPAENLSRAETCALVNNILKLRNTAK